ncbi:MAG: hypothetical protein H5T72_04790 [Actinobacteria bacterium]|nr:hypothetical protein [Actinomycetota bacterium]
MAQQVELCAECGVPALVGSELRWESGGVISLAQSPHNRMVIYESTIIDNVFRGIEKILGRSIEPMVVESRRRETRRFIERGFPFEVRNTLLLGDAGQAARDSPLSRAMADFLVRIREDLVDRVSNVARVFGYGDVSPEGAGDEPYPWRRMIMKYPYSVPLWKADILGTVEAFEGLDMWIEGEELEEDVHRLRLYPSEHPVELRGKLKRRSRYEFAAGDVEHERCTTCGVPSLISSYRWDLERGIITASDTGRRVAVFGPLALEAVFDDLAAEHGPELPRAVVEAQRLYIHERVDAGLASKVTGMLKMHMARRGLGYLVSLEADRNKLEMKVLNACLELFMVGMTQAFFEIATGREKTAAEWELDAQGGLAVSITAC